MLIIYICFNNLCINVNNLCRNVNNLCVNVNNSCINANHLCVNVHNLCLNVNNLCIIYVQKAPVVNVTFGVGNSHCASTFQFGCPTSTEKGMVK